MSDVLRIATTGNVDDGKSTLIGRLLYETGSLPSDRVEDLVRASRRRGFEGPDFSLLTDGLIAEREQGITIDVAHVYFQTARRKFIVADTPGHEQYTRNMVTGASTSTAALILVDARNGSLLQTYRHFFLSRMLRLSAIIVCVNKMDLVGFREDRYDVLVRDLEAFAGRIGFPLSKLYFVPVSATAGDNITSTSSRTPWYRGKPLLEILETVEVPVHCATDPLRFPVQFVLRTSRPGFADFRAYAGKLASGVLHTGDGVMTLPSRITATVTGIDRYGKDVRSAREGESIALRLDRDLDLRRGDMIVRGAALPLVSRTCEARLCWLDEQSLKVRHRYLLQHGVHRVQARVETVHSVIHPASLEAPGGALTLAQNDIGDVTVAAAGELYYDRFETNKANGAFILIDESTNDTVAVGVCL
jgi:sulfate adenylyltransferase subunit 1